MSQKAKYIFWNLLFICAHLIAKTSNQIKSFSEKAIPENFKQNYQTKEYVYQDTPPGFWTSLKAKIGAWLLELLMNLGAKRESIHSIKTVVYFIIAGFSVYIIAKMFLKKEGQWIFKRKNHHQNTVSYDAKVESIENTDFEELLHKTFTKQDYRLCIKHYYFWILQKLNESGKIKLSNLKNNLDYQTELAQTKFYHSFKKTSYYYNYIWYGEFYISLEKYQQIEPFFLSLLKQIEHEK